MIGWRTARFQTRRRPAGCIVRTTAEVLLALLPEYRFSHESDAASGYKELTIHRVRTPHND
jgi:hypothetical protein